MLPFPQIISLKQKYTHHVLDLHDVNSLQQFLQSKTSTSDASILFQHYRWLGTSDQWQMNVKVLTIKPLTLGKS